MKIKEISISLLFIFLLPALISCSANKQQPMKLFKSLNITNGELLVYSKYIGGENSWTSYFVTKINKTDHLIMTYIDSEKTGENKTMPENYTNFEYRINISAENGSLNEVYFDNRELADINIKLPEFIDLKVNNSNSTGEYLIKYKDNGNEKSVTSRFKFKPGYPVLDMASLVFIGPRLFDINKSGSILIVDPSYVKDPVEGYFKLYGEEHIKTPAGEFDTFKVGFKMTDPFLGKLLSGFTDNFFFWIEDSPRRLMIKSQLGDNINELIKISNMQ